MSGEELGQSVSQNTFDSVNNIVIQDVVLGTVAFIVTIVFIALLIIIWRLTWCLMDQGKTRIQYEREVYTRFSDDFTKKRKELEKQYEKYIELVTKQK